MSIFYSSVSKLLFTAFIFVGFHALAQPKIAAFSPASGPAGSMVTITGTGFNPDPAGNVVYFGAVRAAVASAAAGSLTVRVPTGSTYKPITVLNTANGLSGSSAAVFIPTFSNPFGTGIPANYYKPKINYTTGNSPVYTAIADIDGDGKPDVITAGNSSVSVLRNISNGKLDGTSFAGPVTVATNGQIRSLGVADMDRDGRLDLVLAQFSSSIAGSITILGNTSVPGNISLSSNTVVIPVSNAPQFATAGDIDGDGRIDLVALGTFGSNSLLQLFRNASVSGGLTASSFEAPVIFSLPAFSASPVAAVNDLDGDGRPDIAVANYFFNQVSVWRNTATPGTINVSSLASPVNFSTDGSQENLVSVQVGDLDGDGKPEMITGTKSTNTIGVFRNTSTVGNLGTAAFASRVDYATPSYPFLGIASAAVSDLDGDGKPDLVSGNGQTTSVFRNISTPGTINASSFAPRVEFPSGAGTNVISIGDLDSDGVPEIVSVDGASQIAVLTLDPPSLPPTISSFGPLSAPAGSTVTITGTSFNATSSNNIVYFGAARAVVTGGSATSLTVTVPAGATYQPISVLNTATRLAGYSSKPFNLTFSNPFGSGIPGNFYQPKIDYETAGSTRAVAIGDLDGNGKPELAFANAGSGTITILRNTTLANTISNISFATRIDIPVGSSPTDLAISDLDGDGRLDLAALNPSDNSVCLVRNVFSSGELAAASFQVVSRYNAGTSALNRLAVGDVNGDGRPDLVISNSGIVSNVSILLNTSSGGGSPAIAFAAARIDLTAGSVVSGVTVGDVDGDGSPEIVTGNLFSSDVSVFRNTTGTGSFTPSFAPKVDIPIGPTAYSVALSDVDGDGRPDILVGSSTAVSVIQNLSAPGNITAGSFGSRVSVGSGRNIGFTVAGDADGDGKPDIIAIDGNTGNTIVVRNTASPGTINAASFAPQAEFSAGVSYGAALGDLDGDGIPELATANATTASVFKVGLLSPVYAAPLISAFSPASGPTGTTVSLSGLNFNATPSKNGVFFGAVRAAVISSSATGVTVTAPAGATYQPISILNTDLGLTGYSSKPFVTTFTNPFGSGIPANFYQPKVDFATGTATGFVAFADLDGDGKPDMVTTGAGKIAILRNQSAFGSITAASFAPRTDLTVGGSGNFSGGQNIALGDVDGDGKPDIVVTNPGSNSLSVFRNVAVSGSLTETSFAGRIDFLAGDTPSGVIIRDMDGDGKPDLVVSNYGAGSVSILRNLTTTGSITASSFAPKTDFVTGVYPSSIAAQDIDGDGKPDVVVHSGYTYLSVFRNLSTPGVISSSSFSAKTDFAVSSDSYITGLAVGDVDGDGKPDVVAGSERLDRSTNTVSVFRNTASAGSITSTSFALRVDVNLGGSTSRYITLGDVDGDGKPDIIVPKINDTVSILRNQAVLGGITPTAFAARTNFVANSSAFGAAVADLDGDGKPEIATASNVFPGSVSILKILSAPPPPVVSSITPASGPPGTTVTISGSNFTPDAAGNTVYFGPVKAAVTAASTGSLTVTVPAGATYKPVSVLNNLSGLTGFSPIPFTPTFTNPSGTGIPAGFYQARIDLTNAINSSSYGIATGDLDGDGKPDLVITNQDLNNISVLRNISATGSITSGSFAPRISLAVGSGARSVTLNDIDGDGRLDIIVCNTGTVSILRNTAAPGSLTSASFAPKVDFIVPGATNANAVIVSDLDGDGRPDIVFNGFSQLVSVLRNTSVPGSITTASFAPPLNLALPNGTVLFSIAVNDLDGDGKPEIMAPDAFSRTLYVFRNTSIAGRIDTASFANRLEYTFSFQPQYINSGDLDGDNKPEIVVTGGGSNLIAVMRNLSNGVLGPSSFDGPVYYNTGVTSGVPYGFVTLGDADGDGKPDILLSGPGRVGVLRNISGGPAGSSSFADKVDFSTASGSVYPLVLGDLDGDGLAEIATTTGSSLASIFKINNAPLLPPVITSFTPDRAQAGSTVTITGASFNAAAPGNTVYFGAVRAAVTGGSSTSLTVTVPAGATYQPISVLNTANGLTGYASKAFITTFANPFGTGIPSNYYQPRTDFTTGELPYAVAIGDLDGDGKPDLVSVNANANTVSVLRNTGSSAGGAPAFANRIDFATGADPRAVVISDVDGDGKPDLVVLNSTAGTVSILRNQSASGMITAASFAAKVDFAAGQLTYPYAVAVGDLNGDGRPDLAVGNLLASSVRILRNTSTTGSITAASFSDNVNFVVGVYPRYIAVSDLDGDGKPDLAVANERSSSVSVLRNTTAAGNIAITFADKVDFVTGTNPSCLVAGDLDGDDKPELIAVNYNTHTVSVLRNTALPGAITATSFAPKADFATGTHPFCAALGDADGDGKTDLAVVNADDNTVSILRNTSSAGAPAFAPKVDFACSGYPMYVAMGDLNGDGIPEVVAANGATNTLSVLRVNAPASLAPAAMAAGSDVMTMTVYPNPSRGMVRLELYNLAGPGATLEVVDMRGRIIKRKKIDAAEKAAVLQTGLDLHDQPAGIYYVKLTSVDGIRIIKLVLQR